LGVPFPTLLTGGFALFSKIEPRHADNAFRYMYENQHKLIMASAIYGGEDDNTEALMPNGLLTGHAYSILRLEMARNNIGEVVRLIRIRNPWGNHVEFIGDWSDKSPMWETIPQLTRTPFFTWKYFLYRIVARG